MAKGVKKIGYWKDRRDLLGIRVINLSRAPYKSTILGIPAGDFTYFKVTEWFPDTTPEDKAKLITWLEQDSARTRILNDPTKSKIPSFGIYGLKIQKKYAGVVPVYLEASLFGKPDRKNETGVYVCGYCPSQITESIWSLEKYGKDVRGNHQFSYGNTVWLALQTEGINGYNQVKIEIYRTKKPGETSSEDQQIDHIFGKVEKGEIHVPINTIKWWNVAPLPKPVENFYVKVVDPQKKGSYISQGNTKNIARFLVMKSKVEPSPYSVPTNTTPSKVGLPGTISSQVESCKFTGIEITEPEGEPLTVFNEKTKLVSLPDRKYEAQSLVYFERNSDSFSLEHEAELLAIVQYVMENRIPVRITGYASTDGNEEYNRKLALERAKAVQDYFIGAGIENRMVIVSSALDDVSLPVLARRTEIVFSFSGHSAQALKYEVVAPSSTDKNLTIKVNEYKTHTCFIDGAKQNSHKPKKIWSKLNFEKSTESDTLTLPVKSKLSILNVAPVLQYLWPSDSSCYKYTEIHVHSCRYYSDVSKPTIGPYVYPDIKWELAFELKIKVENYSHVNTPAGSIFAKHQKKAREAGYARWLINKNGKVPISIGIGLTAKWDEEKQKSEVVKDFKSKIELFAKTIAGVSEVAENAINVCRGVAKGTGIPVSFGVEYPKFEAAGLWYLERENGYSQLAMIGEINFAAKPLIGANVTIDLIGALVAVASYTFSGSPAIVKIYNKLKDAGKVIGAEIIAEAKFYGELEILFEALKINSLTGIKGGSLTIGGKLGVRIKLQAKAGDVEIENKIIKAIIPVVEATATAHGYFGGEMKLDSDKGGIFVQPTLKFSGVKVSMELKIKVGWFTRSENIESDIIPKGEKPFGKTYFT